MPPVSPNSQFKKNRPRMIPGYFLSENSTTRDLTANVPPIPFFAPRIPVVLAPASSIIPTFSDDSIHYSTHCHIISFSNPRSSYHVHGQQGCRDAPIALVEYNEFHKQIVDKIVPSKFFLFLKEFRSFNIVRVFYAAFVRTCFSTLIYYHVMYHNNM